MSKSPPTRPAPRSSEPGTDATGNGARRASGGNQADSALTWALSVITSSEEATNAEIAAAAAIIHARFRP